MGEHRLALIGAGGRGRGLAGMARASRQGARIAAVADPVEASRRRAQEELDVPGGRVFADHRQLLDACDGLSGAIVATDVASHARIACDVMEAGLPVYLEKPMTRTIDEALTVVRTARRTGTNIMIGFNLRYGAFYWRLKRLVADGAIGQLMSIEWKEILSAQAWADGYCRAGWYSRRDTVGGWLLEKSCHDVDQINWLADAPCLRVASFGSRRLFVPREDVPRRCTDGCPIEDRCLYSCHKFHPDGPVDMANYVPADRWDLCVYHCGSDLNDRQAAIFEFENGVVAAFSILPVGSRWERVMRVCGTEAAVEGSDDDNVLRIHRHDRPEPIVEQIEIGDGGHGGADPDIVQAFLDYVDDPSRLPRATLEDGLNAMLGAGGVEAACDQGRVVELQPFREQLQA